MKISDFLRWSPRALAVVIVLFTSVFALDVFDGSAGLPETILAFVLHVIPQFLIIIALLIAWRRPRAGGIAFLLLAILSLGFFSKPLVSWAHPLLTLPMLLIGLLFLLEGRFSTRSGKVVRQDD
ncbi:MAG: hypothetical protein P1P76_11230 [Anaerolineales bacterium]|nr:hypothetical protein [Anaerolineales bacterium]